jgi:hypothetical protein
MANRRFIDFPVATTVGANDIILIWQDGLNKQTTKATILSGLPEDLEDLADVNISGLTNGQILRYDSTTGKWENTDQGNLDLNDLNDVSIVSPSNGQVLVYNSSTSKWENSSGGFVPYTGAVTTVNLGAQTIQAGSFVKQGGTSAQFLKADGSVDSNTYLTTGSAAATYVPYTGATADVNLGTHDLTAERGTFQNNGSSDTLTVNHTSGSGKGINVSKGGNGEALLVTKTSGSGNAMAVVGGRTSLVDLSLSSVSNATGNFLTISGGVVHQRTPSETRSDVGAQAQLNGTGFVKASGTTITYDNSTYQVTSEKAQPNGYASLDSNGKVPLVQINDALIGNVNFQGLWNAATNTPTLANPPASGTKGYYYIVSTAGTFASISFEVGDWIISNGTAWGKVDNTDAVSSVFGRTGNVTASNGDYNTSQVTENTNLYYTEARVNANANVAANTAARHNAVTLGTANGLGLVGQELSLGLASAGVTGALSGTDWSTFNSKQNALNGTGFVKISGTTISYDNSTYLTGNQTITLSGVVTGSGTTAITTAIANGAITNAMLANSSFFVGTTSISLGRASALQTLTGISIDGNASSVTNGVYTTGNQTIAGIKTFSESIVFSNLGVINALDLSNNNIVGVNNIIINDPGPNEGIEWAGGNLWKIYESPNDLTTNSGGNLQIVQNLTRRATFNTLGQLELPITTGTAPFVIASTTRVANLNVATSGNADTWTTGRTITIGNTGKSVNGSANVAWSLTEIGAAPSVAGGYLPLSGGTLIGPINLFADQFYESAGLFGFNANNSDLIGLNGIYFNDFSDSPLEGINWYNTSTTWDSLYSANGVLYYTPNRASTTTGTSYTIYHSGNLTNPVTGTGNTNYLSKFTSNGSAIGNSIVFDNGTNVGIGTATPASNSRLTIAPVISTFNIELQQPGVGGLNWQIGSTNNDFNAGGGRLIFTYDNNSSNSILTLVQATSEVLIGTNTPNGNKLRVNGTGFFDSTITATQFIRSGGTSSQFLKADGSVDSTAYGTGSVTSVAALTLGTSGTDLSSSVANGTTTPVITLNVPTASAANRGALSAADWTTFNNKQNALTNPVTGTGTAGQVAYWSSSSAITGESNLFWDATNDRLGIGTASPNLKLQISDNINAEGGVRIRNASSGTDASAMFRMNNDNSTDSASQVLMFLNSSTRTADGGVNTFTIRNNIGDIRLSSAAGGNVIFMTSSTDERMRITAAGRLLINTQAESTFQLDVNGTGRFSGNLLVSNSTDTYPEFRTAPIDADVFLGFTNTGDGNNAWGVGRRNTGEFWITNFTGNFNSGTRTTVLALASTGAATFSSSLRSNSHIIVSDGSASVVLQGYINNALRIAASGSSSSGGNRGDLYAGFGDFNSTVTSQVNNILADGAGVVLQGYVDNTLRIAVRGSGYNDGARGGLLASTGDFSSGIATLGYSPSSSYAAIFNGAVGIGTNVPSTNNNLTLSSSTGFNLELINPGTGGVTWQIGATNNGYGSGGDRLVFTYGGASANSLLTLVQSTANVLIGTTTDAGFKLDVNGTGRFSGLLAVQNSRLGLGIRSSGRGELFLNSSGTDFVSEMFFGFGNGYNENNIRWALSDRGTTTGDLVFFAGPANGGFLNVLSLNKSGAATFSSSVTAGGNGAFNTTSAVSGYALDVRGATNKRFGVANSNSLSGASVLFYTDGNAYADGYIDASKLILQSQSGGNVLIGTTTDNGHKLQIGSTSSDRTSLSFSNTTTTRMYEVGLHGSSGTFPNRFFIFDDFANAYVFTIRATSTSRFHGPLETIELTSESTTKLATISGNVLIGTTTDSTDRLRVNGNTYTNTIRTLKPDSDNRSVEWKFGEASTLSITANKRIRVSVDGVQYWLAAAEV